MLEKDGMVGMGGGWYDEIVRLERRLGMYDERLYWDVRL